ncbi:MAG: LytTR family DNA-binding domain-containing protein [Alphaproteobacteria bacterium]|nr:LytTR family DNA-binding domain-containing protein [Alphaproteobacteria bacterium]
MRERRGEGEVETAPGVRREWRVAALVASGAGVSLAILGAAGTGDVPLGWRVLYWAPLMVLNSGLGLFLSAVLRPRLPAGASPVLSWGILTAAITPAAVLFCWAYGALFSIPSGMTPPSLSEILAPSVVITAAMTGVFMLIERPGAFTRQPEAKSGEPPSGPAFLRRLPPRLAGARVYAVRSEDHYLKVFTSRGEDLILMRLSDAIAELDGLEGAQTHRSWWVAREAVQGVEREGDRVYLRIEGGGRVPVSRPNLRPLRDAGWL